MVKRFYVPTVGEQQAATVSDRTDSGTATAPGAGSSSGLVNINTASAAELQTLSGVEVYGPSIIDKQTQNGGAASVDDLMRVSGMGEKKLAKFKDSSVYEYDRARACDATAPIDAVDDGSLCRLVCKLLFGALTWQPMCCWEGGQRPSLCLWPFPLRLRRHRFPRFCMRLVRWKRWLYAAASWPRGGGGRVRGLGDRGAARASTALDNRAAGGLEFVVRGDPSINGGVYSYTCDAYAGEKRLG